MDLPRRLLRGGKRPRISLFIEAATHSAVPAGKVVELEGCNYPGPQHRCARDPKKVWLSSMLAAAEAVRECTLLRVGDACVLQAGFDGSLVLGASVVGVSSTKPSCTSHVCNECRLFSLAVCLFCHAVDPILPLIFKMLCLSIATDSWLASAEPSTADLRQHMTAQLKSSKIC